jgi:hypothetical protein
MTRHLFFLGGGGHRATTNHTPLFIGLDKFLKGLSDLFDTVSTKIFSMLATAQQRHTTASQLELFHNTLVGLPDCIYVDDIRDPQGNTLLMKAAWKNNLSLVHMLKAHGADCSAVNALGWNAAKHAIRAGHTKVVSALAADRSSCTRCTTRCSVCSSSVVMTACRECLALLCDACADHSLPTVGSHCNACVMEIKKIN